LENRKVQVFRNGNWIEIHFSELAKGDSFRLFEEAGEEVRDAEGNTVFYSTSEPYKKNDGIWSIKNKQNYIFIRNF